MNQKSLLQYTFANIERYGVFFNLLQEGPFLLVFRCPGWFAVRAQFPDDKEPVNGPQRVELWRQATKQHRAPMAAVIAPIKSIKGGDRVAAVIQFRGSPSQQCFVWDREGVELMRRRKARGAEVITLPTLFDPPARALRGRPVIARFKRRRPAKGPLLNYELGGPRH